MPQTKQSNFSPNTSGWDDGSGDLLDSKQSLKEADAQDSGSPPLIKRTVTFAGEQRLIKPSEDRGDDTVSWDSPVIKKTVSFAREEVLIETQEETLHDAVGWGSTLHVWPIVPGKRGSVEAWGACPDGSW